MKEGGLKAEEGFVLDASLQTTFECAGDLCGAFTRVPKVTGQANATDRARLRI